MNERVAGGAGQNWLPGNETLVRGEHLVEGDSAAPHPMNLADVFTVVLVIVGLQTLCVGLWLATAGLFPAAAEGCAEKLGAMPGRCLLAGAAAAVPLLAAGIAISRSVPNAPGKLFGAALIIGTFLAALAGTAGLALRIGRGLPAARDDQEPWRRVRRGGIVLAITYLTLILLPLTLLAGLGALALHRFGRRAAPSA